MTRSVLLILAMLLVNVGCTAIIDAGSYVFASDAGKQIPDAGRDDASAMQPGRDASARDGGSGAHPNEAAIGSTVLALANWACIGLSRCEAKLGDDVAVRAKLMSYCHPEAVRRGPLAILRAAIDAGHIAFDATKGDACVMALSTQDADCHADLGASTVAACKGVFVGKVAVDQHCSADLECTPGLICRGDGQRCAGLCQAPGRQGDACLDSSDCDPRFSCSNAECVAKSGATLPCKTDSECLDGLYCDANGVCVAKKAAGKVCVTGNPMSCADDLLCVKAASGAKSATCGAGAAVGSDCSPENPCVLGGRCVDGSCVVVTRPGGTCNSDDNCPPSTACTDGQCEARPVVGETCDEAPAAKTHRPCIEGLCKSGTCALGKDGAVCPFDLAVPFSACAGYCGSNGRCSTSVKIAGAACEGDYECAPGLVCLPSKPGAGSSTMTCAQAVCN